MIADVLYADSRVSISGFYFDTWQQTVDHPSSAQKMPLDMHEKQVFAVLTGVAHCHRYKSVSCSILSAVFWMRKTKKAHITQSLCAHFLTIKRPFLVIFLSNQDRCGHRVVRAPVVRGVSDSKEEFVLICPLGKSSGEISWILVQMFHCVCMLGIGVGPFDLNENAPQRFADRVSRSSAQRANQKVFPPPDFPRFPCRVYLL